MTTEPDERHSFDGVRFDFPFLSFRIGRGKWGMNVFEHDDAYERARRRVRARLGFYRHLATYAAVIAAFVFIDLITGGGVSSPVLWVAAIWGALLVWHWFNVFVFPSIWSPETEERMIEEELRRQQGG